MRLEQQEMIDVKDIVREKDLAEILISGFGIQAMIWETSPAAAELEELTLNWFKEMMQLPDNWHGVIQDTASTATLVALLTAREKYSERRLCD